MDTDSRSWKPPANCSDCRLGSLTVPCAVDDIRAVAPGERLYATQVVYGDGPVPCPLMLIGEAPGMQEDREGRPFWHEAPAGRVLSKAMIDAGLLRLRVYLTNVVKHRPLDNKINNFPDAVEVCRDKYLLPEIEAVNPRVIVALGKTASAYWFGKESGLIARALPDGRVVIAAPHPSSIARGNTSARPTLIAALKLGRQLAYDG